MLRPRKHRKTASRYDKLSISELEVAGNPRSLCKQVNASTVKESFLQSPTPIYDINST